MSSTLEMRSHSASSAPTLATTGVAGGARRVLTLDEAADDKDTVAVFADDKVAVTAAVTAAAMLSTNRVSLTTSDDVANADDIPE